MKIISVSWIYENVNTEPRMITNAVIEDDNGYGWVYDWEAPRQLRLPEADEDNPNNGYVANSFDEAILVLKEGGYIE